MCVLYKVNGLSTVEDHKILDVVNHYRSITDLSKSEVATYCLALRILCHGFLYRLKVV